MSLLPLITQALSTTALTASSTARLPGTSPSEAFSLISTPSNWASLAVASHRVSGEAVARPLSVGDTVEELAGAPPLLPLQLEWRCVSADTAQGYLALESVGALSGCRREVRSSATDDGCLVELSISYPSSEAPLSGAVDALVSLDNAITTQLLLPNVAAESAVPAKEVLVWSVLIAGWAVSSVGWMSTMGALLR